MAFHRKFLSHTFALAFACMATSASAPLLAAEPEWLAARVNSGELPPMAERLPDTPLVITPTDRPGTPGGDWNHALVGGGPCPC